MKKSIAIFALTAIFTTPGFAELSLEQLPPLFENNTATKILDKAISAYIRTQFTINKTLAKYNIKITTDQGMVILSGNIQWDKEASDAIELAAATPGVKEVDATMLSIKKSKVPFNDLAITAKINGAFLREALWGTEEITVASIDVKTKNGVVYLSGHATDEKQKQMAVELAKSIPGVVWVSSSIKVE